MFNKAIQLLEREYINCNNQVKDNEFYKLFANEKYRHSFQVLGAGNYLIKRINWLKNKDFKYIEMVKTAILLHDIFRFEEIIEKYKGNQFFDHGIAGAEYLRKSTDFSDIRIWLPIKHHGHLIEDLYSDIDYINISDEKIKNEIEQICFIIRDADKIANLHLFTNSDKYDELFLGDIKSENSGKISKIIAELAFRYTTTPRLPSLTSTDKMISYISWFFDVNFQYSIDFCSKLKVQDKLFTKLRELCSNREFADQYISFVSNYLNEHKFLL